MLHSLARCGLHVVQVFSQAGLKSPVIGSIIVGVVNLVGTGIAVTLMDKLGRRPLLIFSHAGMAVCLVSMSVTKYLHGGFILVVRQDMYACYAAEVQGLRAEMYMPLCNSNQACCALPYAALLTLHDLKPAALENVLGQYTNC